MTSYINLSLKKKAGQAEIEAEVPAEALAHYEQQVLERARADFELPGFRKGQVPMELMKQRVNAHAILEEAAGYAIEDAYADILRDEKLETLGRPYAEITKLAAGNPVGFKMTVALLPSFSLPDYKKIGKEVMASHKTPEVTEDEITETAKNIQKFHVKDKEKDAPLPELTDEFVKTMGAFQTVADFRAKIKESLQNEKEHESREKRREAIAEKLAEATKIDVPAILVENELEANRAERETQLAEAKLSFEEYLKRINKTKEEYEKEERANIERQFKTRFIFREIAKKENFVPDEKQVEANVAALMKQHADSDPGRVRSYVQNMLANEQVLKLLEGTPEEKKS